MNLLDIRSQLEDEMAWRRDEIRFLKNQLTTMRNENDRSCYRKSLVVMLYSHYEGFCKTALSIYVQAINQCEITRAQAKAHVTAASLAEVFQAYENTDKKCAVFRNLLPDDTKLHRFARQVDFVSQLDEFWDQKVHLSDDLVDTESNLEPVVLRKILFRLGFPYDVFSKHEGKIHLLLQRRHNIAHGMERRGLEQRDYDEVEASSFDVMDELIKMIMDAIENKSFIRSE